MPKTKEYWWVSVGGNNCEPAVVVKTSDGPHHAPDVEIFTFGCPDALTTKSVELVEKLDDPPDTPKQAARKQAAWDRKRAADAKRGIYHGYRTFP